MDASVLFLGLVLWVTTIRKADCAINATHLGCFSSSDLEEYRTQIHPMTWTICVHLCANKMTKYAGVQAGQNSSCYCGGDSAQFTGRPLHSSCRPCAEAQDKHCGGPDALSLYQLKEQDHEALLIATSEGVDILLQPNVSLPVGAISNLNVNAVAYHYKNNELYVASGKTILEYKYEPLLMHYTHPSTVVQLSSYSIVSLDIDWVRDALYYAHTGSNAVIQVNLEGSNLRNTTVNTNRLKKVVYDQYTGDVFSLDTGLRVCHIYLNLSHECNILLKFGSFNNYQIALDTNQRSLYVIGKFSSYSSLYMASINYEATRFRIIYGGAEINPSSANHILGLEMYGSNVYWAIQGSNNQHIVYSATVVPRGQLQDLKKIYTTSRSIQGLKVFHVEEQKSMTSYLCSRKACSHRCSSETSSMVTCVCPADQALSADGKTCANLVNHQPNPTSSSQNNSSIFSAKDIFIVALVILLATMIGLTILKFKKKATPLAIEQPIGLTSCEERANVYEELQAVFRK